MTGKLLLFLILILLLVYLLFKYPVSDIQPPVVEKKPAPVVKESIEPEPEKSDRPINLSIKQLMDEEFAADDPLTNIPDKPATSIFLQAQEEDASRVNLSGKIILPEDYEEDKKIDGARVNIEFKFD